MGGELTGANQHLGIWGARSTGGFLLGGSLCPPTPCCTPGCRRPPFVLGAPPPAEPSPSLPSVCPCGRSVSLKGLQAWLRGCHPVPAGPGTGQPRTAPDSPGQPHCGRAGTAGTTGTAGTRADPVGLGGGHKKRGRTRDGDPHSPDPTGVIGPITGGARRSLGTFGDICATGGLHRMNTLIGDGGSVAIWGGR